MRINPLLGGPTVYGQGSYAPTRGQVNPQGYIQREIKKRGLNRGKHLGWNKNRGVSQFGRDGASDTRSGLAARALSGGGTDGGRTHLGSGAATPTQGLNPTYEPPPQNTGNLPTATPSGGGGRPGWGQYPLGSDGMLGDGGRTHGGPQIPTISINANGQIDLPYNQEFSEAILSMRDDINSQLMELQQGSQNEALQYAIAQRGLDTGFGQQQRQTLNDNAGRGTAFSSGYGLAVGNDTSRYNQAKNDALAQHNQFGQQVDAERASLAAAFQDFIRRSLQSMGHELGDTSAGTLGFGTGTRDPIQDPHPNKRRRKKRNR